jgi:6-phosphogluconolactonase (cycloisomerase 2 family)
MVLVLTACGGGGGGGSHSTPPAPAPAAGTIPITGSVIGLSAAGLVLEDGTESLAVPSNASSFTFPTKLVQGTAYAVSVMTQPVGETCAVTNGSGTAQLNQLVTVTCSPNVHAMTGSVSNLLVDGLTLTNGTQQIDVPSGATSFDFFTPLPEGTAYQVAVTTQPDGQHCAVQNASGTVGSSDATNVSVVCRLLQARVTDSSGAGSVHSYTFGLDGSLTASGTIAAGAGARAIAGTPDASLVYVVNSNDNSISSYAAGIDGSLTSLGAATPAGTQPTDLAITPDGRFLYVAATGDEQIRIYAIGASGNLSLVATTNTAMNVTKLAITPNGLYLYYLGFDGNSVAGYAIGQDGRLTALGQGIFTPSNVTVASLAVSPDGKSLYLAGDNFSKGVQLALASDGTLSALSPVTVLEQPGQVRALVVGLFSVIIGTPNLSVLTRDINTGLLSYSYTPVSPFTTPLITDMKTVPQAGNANEYLLLVDSVSSSVAVMTVNEFGSIEYPPTPTPLVVGGQAQFLLIQ